MEKVVDKKLLRLQARRRGHLKAALRKYAKVFRMEWWFTHYVTAEEDRLYRGYNYFRHLGAVPNSREDADYGEDLHLPSLNKFEECGTTCCIGGLDYMRSGRSLLEQQEFYGLSPFVYAVTDWPENLKWEYRHASNKMDYKRMVELAEKAIDYFGKQQ